MKINLSKWNRTGVKEKGELEEDNYKFLNQFYKERKELLCHTADGVVACGRKDEEKNSTQAKPHHTTSAIPNRSVVQIA